MSFCPNCGAKVGDGVKFCTECGTRLAAPAAPAAPAPETPAAMFYETPAPAPEAPEPMFYETPAPAPKAPEPMFYETPAPAPAEQPPAPPVQTPPPAVPTYKPPVQQPRTPPAAAPVYDPKAASKAAKPAKAPKAPKAAGGGKKLLPIIAGAAVLVILLIVLLVSCGGKDQGTEADWGVYEGVSCKVSGMDLGAEGEWVELQKKGKATLFIMGSEYSAKWTLEGEDLVIKQGGDEFAGTLKNGVIEVDMAGMVYTFSKGGAAAQAPAANQGGASLKPTEKEPEAQPEAQTGGAASYKLVSFTADGEELGSDMIELMGGGYVVLNGDGTGMFSMFGDTFPITYTDTEIDAGGMKLAYTLTATGLEFTMEDGSTYVLETSDEVPDLSVPAAGEGDGAEADGVQMWSGDYYGFWVVDSVWANSHDWVEEGAYWDTCATVELNADGTGTMIIWDEDFTKEEPLAELGITASMTGGVGRFVSEDGQFMGEPLTHADWLWYTDATEYGDLFIIEGQFDDGEDDFWYEIYLRPWGVDWSDVLANDPNMDPYYYESWYLPLVESGVTEAPTGFVGE